MVWELRQKDPSNSCKNLICTLALFKISDLRQCIDSVCLITNATCFEMFSELVVPFFKPSIELDSKGKISAMCHYGGAVVACSTDKSIKVRSNKDIGRISVKKGEWRE